MSRCAGIRPLTTAPIASPVTNVRLSLPLSFVCSGSSAFNAPLESSTHTLSGFGVTLPTCSLLPVWQWLLSVLPYSSPVQQAWLSSGMV